MSDEHTRALRADALVEARMSAAYRDGEATAQTGERRVNPWRGDGDTAVERVLAVAWAKGYSAGNPISAP